jgi:8-oxo-dGTP pyrophosphatase MutT (NUDIX family)
MNLKTAFLQRLQEPLPGEKAHKELLPTGRLISSLARSKVTNPILAAVAVHIVVDTEDISMILIERSNYAGVHSGQIAFPGGKVETEDVDLLSTARRESEEEIGIPRISGQCIAPLTSVYIPVSNYEVSPFLLLHDEFPLFALNEREVNSIIVGSLNSFSQPDAIHFRDVTTSLNLVLKNVPGYYIGEKWLWGATALIVSELVAIYRETKILTNSLSF